MPADSPACCSLRIREAELQQCFDTPQTAMLILGPQGVISDVNPAMCRGLGYTRGAIQGQALAELGAAATPALSASAVDWLLLHGHLRCGDLPLRTATGGLRHMDFRRVGSWTDQRILFACHLDEGDPDPGHAWPAPITDAARTAASNRLGILSAMELEALAVEEIQLTRSLRRPLSLLSIGVDRLHRTGGTEARDPPLSLYAIAKACTANLRDRDMVGRIDRAIFVALLPGVTAQGAKSTAERLRAAIAALDTPIHRGRLGRVTVSIGAVTTRTGLTSYQALRSRADAKRDDARNSGGNRVNA